MSHFYAKMHQIPHRLGPLGAYRFKDLRGLFLRKRRGGKGNRPTDKGKAGEGRETGEGLLLRVGEERGWEVEVKGAGEGREGDGRKQGSGGRDGLYNSKKFLSAMCSVFWYRFSFKSASF